MPPPSRVLSRIMACRRGSSCATAVVPTTMCVCAPSRDTCRRTGGWATGGGTRSREVSPPVCAVHPVRCSRSEEHTSELQSRLHLVCRLLLEKKKKIYKINIVLI